MPSVTHKQQIHVLQLLIVAYIQPAGSPDSLRLPSGRMLSGSGDRDYIYIMVRGYLHHLRHAEGCFPECVLCIKVKG